MGDIYQGGRDAAEHYFFWGQKLKPLVTKYKFVRKLSMRVRRELNKRPGFKDFLNKCLKDKDFEAEFERLRPGLETVEKSIKEKDNEQ
jgi:hypothetical protein